MDIPYDAEKFEYDTPAGECRLALVTYGDDEDSYGEPYQYVEVWQVTAYDEDGNSYILPEVTSQEEEWANEALNPPKRVTRRDVMVERRANFEGIDL
jgi:hypothetical protein